MILSTDETLKRLVASGAWSRVTLDQVFRQALLRDPGRVAFRDVGEPAVPGLSSCLSLAEADRRIEALAAFFAGVGLKPDTVVGIHLPPSADAAVTVLAALRAGLIVCPVGLHLSGPEIAGLVGAANIRALVTAASVEGEPTGENVRAVAGETFAIRFVFALGADVPDGLMDLADVLAEAEALGPAPAIVRRGHAGDHVALVSPVRSADDRPAIAAHTHNHLLATALAHGLETGLGSGETLLSTMHPASLASLAGAVATALLNDGEVAFHHPTGGRALVEATVASGAVRVVMPAALAPTVEADLPSGVALSLVSTGQDPCGAPDLPADRSVLDLLTLGGLCLLPVRRRPDGTAGTLPAGPYRPPLAGGEGPVLFEASVKARVRPGDRRPVTGTGELVVSGAIIPDAPWPEPMSGGGPALALGADGALKPGIAAQASADQREIRLRGPLSECLIVGGRTVSAERLDRLLRDHPDVEDAAVFPVEADLVGMRIGVAVVPRAGSTMDLAGISAFLAEAGVGETDRPVTLRPVREIPRASDGAVLRQTLFLSAVA